MPLLAGIPAWGGREIEGTHEEWTISFFLLDSQSSSWLTPSLPGGHSKEIPCPYPSKPKDRQGPSVELDSCRVGLQLDGGARCILKAKQGKYSLLYMLGTSSQHDSMPPPPPGGSS